jgi:hypothetical protein
VKIMYINKLDDGTINLTAPVLIPEAKDCDYHNGEEPLNKTQIQRFKESYDKYGFVDHEHGLTRDGRRIGEPSDSIILDQDTTFTLYDGTTRSYPVGTWMLTTHITDDEAISEAMKGYYTGYSPSILPRASADKYLAALKAGKGNDCACKNQVSSMGNSLIKDVPDPVVLSVSLTRQPCLHESKFCELNGEIMEDEVSLKSKILTAIGMTEEAEVLALKAEIKDLDAKIEAMQNEFQKSLEALQADFKQILTDALKPVEEEPAEEETEPEEVAEKAEAEPTEEEAEVEVEEADEEETTEEPVEEVEEEPIEEEPIAEKGESKQEPVHDNLEAQKSKPKSVYELMGRYPNGVKIRR